MAQSRMVRMEFHVSRRARDLYQFDEALFTTNGNIIFANFHAARLFAQKMNARRDLANFPERAVRASQINALGLLDEILHLAIHRYRQERNPQVTTEALAWLENRLGVDELERVLLRFTEEFPPMAVQQRQVSVAEYLAGASLREDGQEVSNREIALEELLMLWLSNANPACAPYLELFDDENLELQTAYTRLLSGLYEFFDAQPPFGPDNQNLIDMLRAPALASPHSLSGQLEYIRNRWSTFLGRILYRLLSSLDLVREEEKPVFGVGGAGPSYVYEFKGAEYEEVERFSPDRDWMPNLVLLAKNSYVWLDQLSRQYKRAIFHLDHIPDEELERLARSGISGLWLIGLWERSPASKRIKQLRGNPDAVASAYSLFYYDIAADLGGEEAFQRLRQRAWRYGVRLASDMVPNHMGIDSRWVIEHPHWFISLDYPPFPSYTFNGVNLSWDERVGIYLEDHYYDNTDAAVVFKRVDFWTGSVKYIYHGNDGTSMPWNDTAQLNYLLPEVREAVIQTILHVARKFPIIRFDAAMTLAKRHYQRLWFPEPGSGGDIPSRAGHGLTRAEFDRAFPEEFWREVVDRVAQEAPDTLLLAEAFWLMEGYFVRTLGMHRVYNSAFMNMLRDEKNQEYRLVIKNTVEFDPEILKRYVNFMNNPDERTAVDQFGKGDKYFGICTLMATMPGLPMFGHGQIEGFAEKYGMEFAKPKWNEEPDPYLVERHEREIFPLLRKRYLFAQVQNFRLYDFYLPEGHVNEDVYAYSNQAGAERSLVVYHNKYADTRGWVRLSAAYPVKSGQGDERILMQSTLAEALGLHAETGYFLSFRDHITGLQYLRSSLDLAEQGLYLELGAYKCHVFLEFQEIQDDESGRYAQLASYLAGRGVPSLEEALREILFQPVRQPFGELVNVGMLDWLVQNRQGAPGFDPQRYLEALEEADAKILALCTAIHKLADYPGDPKALALEISADVRTALALPAYLAQVKASPALAAALDYLRAGPRERKALESGDRHTWGFLLAWLLMRKLGKLADEAQFAEQSRTWIDEWLLGKLLSQALVGFNVDEKTAARYVALSRWLTSQQNWFETLEANGSVAAEAKPRLFLRNWLQDQDLQRFLLFHRYQGVLWFNKEAFDEFLWWLAASAWIILYQGDDVMRTREAVNSAQAIWQVIQRLQQMQDASGYQVDKLLS